MSEHKMNPRPGAEKRDEYRAKQTKAAKLARSYFDGEKIVNPGQFHTVPRYHIHYDPMPKKVSRRMRARVEALRRLRDTLALESKKSAR